MGPFGPKSCVHRKDKTTRALKGGRAHRPARRAGRTEPRFFASRRQLLRVALGGVIGQPVAEHT